MTDFIHRLCIPDEHYAKIKESLKDAGRIGIYLTDKNGKRVRFYKKDGVIYADERKDDDTVFTQEVIKMSEIQQVQNEHSVFKQEMLKRIQADHPDMPLEEQEAYADVLREANDSIKKLIASGVEPSIAYKIIESVLQDKEIIDNTMKDNESNSAEALAEVLRDRERLFGNPKDPNYGKESEEELKHIAEAESNTVVHPEGVPIV